MFICTVYAEKHGYKDKPYCRCQRLIMDSRLCNCSRGSYAESVRDKHFVRFRIRTPPTITLGIPHVLIYSGLGVTVSKLVHRCILFLPWKRFEPSLCFDKLLAFYMTLGGVE